MAESPNFQVFAQKHGLFEEAFPVSVETKKGVILVINSPKKGVVLVTCIANTTITILETTVLSIELSHITHYNNNAMNAPFFNRIYSTTREL